MRRCSTPFSFAFPPHSFVSNSLFILYPETKKMKLYSILPTLLGLSYAQTQKQIIFNPGASVPSIASIPAIGFGTWRLDKSNASDAVSVALQTGYRHVDCAAIYGNEKEVGNGIKEGLKTIGLDRSSVWITSKLWNDQYVL